MADQAERVILKAEDQVTPVVDKANAGLDSFEKKAESSHSKVIRISDQTRSSVQRLIASLEKQAETYGKSGVDHDERSRRHCQHAFHNEPGYCQGRDHWARHGCFGVPTRPQSLQIGRSGEYQAAVNRRKSPGTERVPLDLFSRAVPGDDALALPWSASRTHHTRS